MQFYSLSNSLCSRSFRWNQTEIVLSRVAVCTDFSNETKKHGLVAPEMLTKLKNWIELKKQIIAKCVSINGICITMMIPFLSAPVVLIKDALSQ